MNACVCDNFIVNVNSEILNEKKKKSGNVRSIS